MTSACALRDPELSAEERAELLYGAKQKRPVVKREAPMRVSKDWFKAMHAVVDQAKEAK